MVFYFVIGRENAIQTKVSSANLGISQLVKTEHIKTFRNTNVMVLWSFHDLSIVLVLCILDMMRVLWSVNLIEMFVCTY